MPETGPRRAGPSSQPACSARSRSCSRPAAARLPAAPVATPAPVTSAGVSTVTGSPPASATPAPATLATPAPTGQVVATTSPLLPAIFISPLYGYTIDLPEGSDVAAIKAATAPWDGESANFQRPWSTSSRALDKAWHSSCPRPRTSLDAYAAAVHAKAVREHGCSEELTDERDVEIDGTPARVVASACQGLLVYEATMVRDGTGLIAKQSTPPPGTPGLAKKILDDFMWLLEPLKFGR